MSMSGEKNAEIDWDDDSTSTVSKIKRADPLFPDYHMALNIRAYEHLYRRFSSTEDVVSFLESGGDLTDIKYVGKSTALSVLGWLEDEHPAAYEERKDRLGVPK